MPSYYLSEDLARFGEMAKTNPQLFDLFMKWYAATMEKGALDAKTKKLIAPPWLRHPEPSLDSSSRPARRRGPRPRRCRRR